MATETAPKTLREAILFFADYEHCRKAIIAIRWPDGVVRCPRCGSENVTYLSNQRRYKCYAGHPRAQFSLKIGTIDRKSTRLNSSHANISYAVFCLKKKIRKTA